MNRRAFLLAIPAVAALRPAASSVVVDVIHGASARGWLPIVYIPAENMRVSATPEQKAVYETAKRIVSSIDVAGVTGEAAGRRAQRRAGGRP